MYASFYGLLAEPFQLTPDHRFFFESSVHRQALAHLTYGLSQGEGFIVITGDIGAGKTTLVSHLLTTLDPKKFVAAKVVTTQLGADDLLRAVVTAFGVRADLGNKAEMLRQLEAFFVQCHRGGRRCVLLIDEAQNLSPEALEELRMLSNFQVGERAPLQSFILGQPQFRALLNSPELEQLRQRIIANYHLAPLDAAETRAYIEHRLHTAGWKNDPAMGDDVFAAIFARTEGVPRRINNLCNRLFLYGFLEEKHAFEAADIERVAQDMDREENPDIRGKDLIALPRHGRGLYQESAATEELRRRLDQIEQRGPAAGDSRVMEDLRRRLDLLEEYVRLRAMADRAYEDLLRRVSAIEEKGDAAPALGPLIDRIAALESRPEAVNGEAAHAIDPARLEALEQRVAALASAASAEPSPALLERLAAVEARLAQPMPLDERLQPIEAQLASLTGELPERLRGLEMRVGEVAAAAANGSAPPAQIAGFDELGRRVDELAQRLNGGTAPAELAHLVGRIEKLETAKPSRQDAASRAALAELEKSIPIEVDRAVEPIIRRLSRAEDGEAAMRSLSQSLSELSLRLAALEGELGEARKAPVPELDQRLEAMQRKLALHEDMMKRAMGVVSAFLERGKARAVS